MADDEDVGEVGRAIRRRIREKRQEEGLSQGELAAKVGVSQGAYSRYETERTPSAALLHAIARALGTTMADMLIYVPGEPSGGTNPEARRAVREAVERWLGE